MAAILSSGRWVNSSVVKAESVRLRRSITLLSMHRKTQICVINITCVSGRSIRFGGVDKTLKRPYFYSACKAIFTFSTVGFCLTLTHYDLVTPWIWVNIDRGSGLLRDDTKPLPEPKLSFHYRGTVSRSKDSFIISHQTWYDVQHSHMMTSSNGNIFHVTGHLCGEFTGHRWIPLTKASDAELWCFLCARFETTSCSLWRRPL